MLFAESEVIGVTLDYRAAGTGQHRVQRVMEHLLMVHSLRWTGVVLKLLVGVPLCLFGPLVVTILAVGTERHFRAEVLPEFWATFALATLGLVPALMYWEHRTRGDFLSDALMGTDYSRPSSYGEYMLRSERTKWVVFMELALYGPRLLWGVIDFFRKRTMVDAPLRRVAAHVVVNLLDREGAVNVRELVGPARPAPMLIPALRFLQECDWVDLSRKRDRVWLRSPIRNRLANL